MSPAAARREHGDFLRHNRPGGGAVARRLRRSKPRKYYLPAVFGGRTRDVVPRCEADLIACDALIARIAVDDSVVRGTRTQI